MDTLSNWLPFESSIHQTSWKILRDMLHSDIYFHYRPQEIAIAIIYFVLVCYKIKVPHNESAETYWWEVSLEKKLS